MPQPIPTSLMPSSAAVRVPVDGKDGGEHEQEARLIEHVRYESASAAKRSSYVFADGSTGLVYIDAANSIGAFEVPVGSLVSIDGAPEVCVVKCAPFESYAGRVHHWEVEVR